MVIWTLTATISFIFTLLLFKLNNPSGSVWFFLSLGMFCWCVADIIWFFAQIVLRIGSPFPYWSDLFYLLSYIFFIIGIVMMIKLAEYKLRSSEQIVTLVTIIIVIVLVSILYIKPIIEYYSIAENNEGAGFEPFLYLYYPIADLILASSCLVLVFKYRGGQYSHSWLILCIGFFIAAGYDLLYSYASWNGYDWSMVIDQFYYLMYMLFVYGALHIRNVLKEAHV